MAIKNKILKVQTIDEKNSAPNTPLLSETERRKRLQELVPSLNFDAPAPTPEVKNTPVVPAENTEDISKIKDKTLQPLIKTIDEHRQKQETQKQTESAILADREEKKKEAEKETEKKLFFDVLSKAPAGVKVSDYIDAMSATGQLDEKTNAWYTGASKTAGKDPALDYSLKLAQQMATAKEKELADYLASEEYKQAEAEYADAVNRGAANFQVAFSTEKQKALEAELEYYQRYVTSFSEQQTMMRDLAILEKWPEEDKKLLDSLTYSTGAFTDSYERLAEKYGEGVVDNVLETYKRYKNAGYMEDVIAFAQKHGGLGDSIFGIPSRIVGSVTGTLDYIGQGIGKLLGTDTGRYGFDTNTIWQIPSAFGSELMKQDLKEVGLWAGSVAEANGAGEKVQQAFTDVATTVYAAGTNAAENLTRVVATGGVGSLALAAASSFQDAVTSATKQGANPMQAIGMGIISASLETITEKIPLDNLLSSVGKAGSGGWGKVVLEALKQAGVEVTTEEANFIGTTIAEAAILKEKSGYKQMIAELVAGGMSYADAKKQADKALMQQAGQIAIQTALSGAMSSVGSSVINNQSGKFTDIADQYEQDKQTGKDDLSEMLDRIFAKRQPQQQTQTGEQINGNTTLVLPETPTTPQQTAPSGKLTSDDLTDIIDEAVAKRHGAPADPIAAALESIANGGAVTNKQAQDIMNNTRAVQRLVKEAGLKELNGTASQNRAAVKAAVLRLSQQQTAVDTTQNTDYDNINNTQGGNIYAEGLQQNDRAGSIGNPAQGMAGVQSANRAESQGREQHGGVAVHTGILRVSDALTSAQQKRGTTVYPVQDTTSSPAAYEQALIAGRESDARNGWCVTPKSAQELADGNVRTFMNESGTVGVGIAPDGDIVAVFKNQNGGPRKALDTLMPIAIEQGGDRLDCYGEGLVGIYAQYGFVPVARVEFNAEYANEGWTPDKGTPYIYFMMHNGDSAASVAEKMGSYPEITKAQLDSLPTYGKDDYDAAMAYRNRLMDQRAGQQNSSNDSTPPQASPTKSVGAAPGWFDPNTRLQYEYGTIPEGENPVRPDDLPKRDYVGNKVSYTARTVKGAEATSDELVDLLNKDTVEGGMSYIPITNNETVQKAYDHIKEEGWEMARGEWSGNVRAGKAGADLVAQGALLLNNAAKAGDKTAWLEILHDYQLLGTNTAQGLQALRILKTLTPDDKLYMARRSVKQMVQDMHLDTEVTIDEALEAEFLKAKTDEQRDAILKKIQKNVASQLPATFMEKFTALRYVNMLGNLRTQGRNILGNLGMKAVRSVHNAVASNIEAIASKASGGKLKRTRSAFVSKAQKAAASKDFDHMQSVILEGGKYNDGNPTFDSSEFARGVQKNRRIFGVQNGKWYSKAANFALAPLEGYRKATNWAMEKGDVIFARSAYARALAGYLKANGITETDYSKVDTAVMDDARLFAAKEAQEATFRDTNWLSGWISKVGRRKDTPAAVKFISEGVMPFRKTPANVLVRAEEYSPLGVINSLVTSIRAMQKNSDVTGAQVINSWAKTLTGTGIFGLGMLLSNLGILSAGPDDDKDKDKFDSLNGWQNYALTIPGTDINFTIDFLSPSAMPMLMGAQLMEMINDGGIGLKDFESALTSLADPMIEMSMLQGVNDTLDKIQYADNNLGQLLISSGLNYLTQGLTNTFLGQLERTFEDSRTQTYVDKESALPDWLQQIIGKASAKTPGWDYQQIPYINAWGEEEENPEWYINGAYNTLSSAYIEKGVSNELTQELNRLNDAQGDVNVYPSEPDKTVTYGGTTYNLSAEEYVALAKKQGQLRKDLVESIIGNEAYAALSDEEKAAAISYAYDYARDFARGEVLEGHPGVTTGWMKDSQGNIADGILQHVAEDTLTDALSAVVSSWKTGNSSKEAIDGLDQAYKAFDGLSDAMQKKIFANASGRMGYYLAAKDAGISTGTFAKLYKTFYDIDNSGSKASEKASKWSYELEKAKENGTITNAQRDALKGKMNFWQMIPAETKKFDALTGSGISADASAYIVDLVMGIQPLPGKSEATDYQKVKAITGADNKLTEDQQKIVLKNYLDEKSYAKYLDILKLGLDNDEYAAAYELYATESGEGKKKRTIEKFMKEFQISHNVATALYEIYNPK